MSHSETWQNARARRTARRAADPQVQARAEARIRSAEQDRQQALRKHALREASDALIDGAA